MKRSGIAVEWSFLSEVEGQRLLSFVVMSHSDDYISLFAPFFDIPVSLSNLFQRIASIDDRFYLSRLYKLSEEY